MILTCPECSTRYVVKPASIPAGGRNVRCAKCGHSWHQEAMEDFSALESLPLAEEDPRPTPIPSFSNLPAQLDGPLITPRSLKFTFLGLLALTLASAFFIYREPFTRAVPALQSVYAMLGQVGSEGVAFGDVRISPIPGRKPQYLVEGELLNASDKPRVTPKLYVTQLDQEKRVLDSQLVERDPVLLQPGTGSAFRFKVSDKTGKTAFITLDLGSARN